MCKCQCKTLDETMKIIAKDAIKEIMEYQDKLGLILMAIHDNIQLVEVAELLNKLLRQRMLSYHQMFQCHD